MFIKVFILSSYGFPSKSKHDFRRKCKWNWTNNKYKSSHKNHEDIKLNKIKPRTHIFLVDLNLFLSQMGNGRWGWVLIKNKMCIENQSAMTCGSFWSHLSPDTKLSAAELPNAPHDTVSYECLNRVHSKFPEYE